LRGSYKKSLNIQNKMKINILKSTFCLLAFTLFSFQSNVSTHPKMPYTQAGLLDRQAAAHLLSRFTFGAKPGQIDAVLSMGLENWLEQQLNGVAPETKDFKQDYEALSMSYEAVQNKYLNPAQLKKALRIEDGISKKDTDITRADYRDAAKEYLQKNNLKLQYGLYEQVVSHKIMQAQYAQNQLKEVMTDFWFNHFNVSVKKNLLQALPAYEMETIRPHVLGNFEDLLLATAHAPAMLIYLDNFISVKENAPTYGKNGKNNNKRGLNENYAREIMELHTLGVEGGYSQSDVTQLARLLTGWSLMPYQNPYMMKAMNTKKEAAMANGRIVEGDFVFYPNLHDSGEKTFLGKKFPENGGYTEGVTALKILAEHPSTMQFISRKLAIRFVSDNPSKSLVDKMALTFKNTKGNIKEVLKTMVYSPEFWDKNALREKTKSPFELAMSATRSLNADIKNPVQLAKWLEKMGQRCYDYLAPTGFPDNAEYWINTGSLLNRMNFGLALAYKEIKGVTFSLAELNQNREPESAELALAVYSKILLPERDLTKTIERLQPIINDPSVSDKIKQAAAAQTMKKESDTMMQAEDMQMADGREKPKKEEKLSYKSNKKNNKSTEFGNQSQFRENKMLAQVVGIIIGSPEYQRR
jgi:uncharacterized protein (DUF1800 family)